ncbi:MAG: PIN domain-containing protein [Planctomycetes bacterium]|nr:PIN domain-containing protein [Planctomycetota bacterium]
MASLIDTGVLLRAFDTSSPEYRPIRQALRTLWLRQERLVVTLQNLAEFWNVSTRPIDKNGFGLSAELAERRLTIVERICEVVTEDEHSYRIWKGLLITHAVTGVAVHDARLVSVMLARGVSTVVTLNERDFQRYGDIAVVNPRSL